MVAQELEENNWKNWMACCKDIIWNILANAILHTSDKSHIHLYAYVNKQNFFLLVCEQSSSASWNAFRQLMGHNLLILIFLLQTRPNSYSNLLSVCADALELLETKAPSTRHLWFFLFFGLSESWGFYKHWLRMINELKAATCEEIAVIMLEVSHQVMWNLINHLQMCIVNESNHPDNIQKLIENKLLFMQS